MCRARDAIQFYQIKPDALITRLAQGGDGHRGGEGAAKEDKEEGDGTRRRNKEKGGSRRKRAKEERWGGEEEEAEAEAGEGFS